MSESKTADLSLVKYSLRLTTNSNRRPGFLNSNMLGNLLSMPVPVDLLPVHPQVRIAPGMAKIREYRRDETPCPRLVDGAAVSK